MKKTTALLLLSMFALVTVTTSCKKYEDGPAISLLTKKQRLCRTWLVKSIAFGGVTIEDDSFDGYTYDFKKNGDLVITEEGVSTNGTWAFANDKEDLTLTTNGQSQTVEIRRLTNKELWLKDTDEEFNTEIVLKLEEK